ncbi:MAG: hypothetical protein ACYC26_14600 [Phycisphaerales bacterium]
MIDSTTQERMIVSTDGTAGSYIMVPLNQLKAVEDMLQRNGISYWVDANAISLNGKPEITVINLGRSADANSIQQLLDVVG